MTDTNGVRFVDPTKARWTKSASSKIKDKFDILKGFIFNKDTESKLRTMEMPTRDEIAIRRDSEHLRQAATAQVKQAIFFLTVLKQTVCLLLYRWIFVYL